MIGKIKDESELRRTVEGELGRQLDDEIWEALKAEGYIGAFFDPDLKPKERDLAFCRIIDAAKVALRLHKPRRPPDQAENSQDETLEALIDMQVQEAIKDIDVAWLRDVIFQGKLAEPDKETEFLSEVCQTSDYPVHRVELSAFIQKTADKLARTYGWTPESARAFILTGQKPKIEKFRMSPSNWNTEYPLASTITITVNIACPPRELARAFGKFQRALMATLGIRDSTNRNRPLSEKHRQLAIFSVQHEGLSGREAMLKWNACYDKWKYKYVTNFQRDRNAALKRFKRKPEPAVLTNSPEDLEDYLSR